MHRPRSRPAIVATLACAYPLLVMGLAATAYVTCALLTREDGSDEFADFDEGGALIAALLLALPLAVVVAHVAWSALAVRVVPLGRPVHCVTAAVLLALATTGAVVVLGSGVGSLNPRGWTRVALVACVMAGLAASAAVSLTRHRSSSATSP